MSITWGGMRSQLNFYQLALEEFHQKNPMKRRVSDITEAERQALKDRAAELKKLAQG